MNEIFALDLVDKTFKELRFWYRKEKIKSIPNNPVFTNYVTKNFGQENRIKFDTFNMFVNEDLGEHNPKRLILVCENKLNDNIYVICGNINAQFSKNGKLLCLE